MAADIIKMKGSDGKVQYPVTSSEAVGMSDGSGNLDKTLATLDNGKKKYVFSDSVNANLSIPEIYIRNITNYGSELVCEIIWGTSSIGVTLYRDSTIIAAYYDIEDYNNIRKIVYLSAYKGSGIDAYVLIDLVNFTELTRRQRFIIKGEYATKIEFSPTLRLHLYSPDINNISFLSELAQRSKEQSDSLFFTETDKEDSVLGYYYKYSNKQYTQDAYNGFTCDFYTVKEGESIRVYGYKKGTSVALIALLSSKAALNAEYVYEAGDSNSDFTEVDKVLLIPKGITYVGISRPTNNADNPIKLYSVGNTNRLDTIEKDIKNIQQWQSISTSNVAGKKLLSIGDSTSAAKQYQPIMQRLLGLANVRYQVKGGIGLIQMVDGDGAVPPPDFDPDTDTGGKLYPMTKETVKDIDIIVFWGPYNDISLITNVGVSSDMYPNQDTLWAKMNYVFKRTYECLKEAKNMRCKIFWMGIHCHGNYPYASQTAYDNRGGDGTNSFDFSEKVKEICGYHSIQYIDLINNLGINKYNWNDFQKANTNTNQSYIGYTQGRGANDKDSFPTLEDLQAFGSPQTNDRAHVETDGNDFRKYNGSIWEIEKNVWSDYRPWLPDHLHLNNNGYSMVGAFCATIINQYYTL
ncbi:hypothetical protein O6P32_13255 [Phocaeicola sp. KGMB11183]|uniref:SGNH hydrolase-type esterase domain-containing protein n=1 Tax=Phocaeicola acetigenes TaxID=3016083 RepID=A0ABT4PKS9_9BACT|nr:hypothetical protein [Phocaeicola sp. KGMB11183]MCZ8373665.1 hypothetical protein [Phocaeicola sp. KGMB11183]